MNIYMVDEPKEEKIIDGYEEVLYRYFKAFQNPNKYSFREFSQVLFLSKRFYLVYQILIKKYPELEFKKDVYLLGNDKPKYPTLYINDVISELPRKIGFKDRMVFSVISSLQDIEEVFRVNDTKEIIHAPWYNNPEEFKIINKDLYLTKKMRRRTTGLIHREKIRRCLDSLGCELQYLKNNGINDAYDLAPIAAQKYFKVIFSNAEQIRYFLRNFNFLQYGSDSNIKVTSDKELLLIQKEVLEQTKNHFKDNLDLEVLTFFATIIPSYFNFFHYPLILSFKDIYHRLNLLDNLLDDEELVSKDFTLERLNEK